MKVSRWLPKVLRFWGVDRAIAYTVIGRAWSVLAGPITLLLIATFLSSEEQGFYYTFTSILALQVFLELGLSFVIFQFASHEKAKLEWTEHGILEGDPTAKARLSSLLYRALIWYSVLAVLVIAIMLPAGLIFFGHHQPAQIDVMWQLPWIWVVAISAGNLAITPVLALLEGCGLVAEIALVRTCQAIVGNLLAWLVLSRHWGLFTVPVFNTVGLLWSLGWLVLYKRSFLADLALFRRSSASIDWWREVWPFQWKIALSGVSSYFIFLLFNPVLFAFHGAAAAGQMGMSMNIMGAISVLAIAWVGTKASYFGTLIAKRDFKALDQMFFPALWQSLLVITMGGVVFWIAAFYLHNIHHPMSQRILDPLPLGLLIAAAIINHIVWAESMYLRAYKQEPFLILSIIVGCLVGVSTYFLGKQFAATGMMAGNLIITLIVGLGGGTWIFVRKRRIWCRDVEIVAAEA